MLEGYFPVLLFIAVGLVMGGIMLAVGWGISSLLGVNRPDSEKLSPYECGFEAFEDARMRFDVRYYLVAILFILFDLEIVFMYPWAVVYRDFVAQHGAGTIFWSMFCFVSVLTVGYVYAIMKGALDWKR